jgi:1-acyl-sn-glycerol-3-phosphate acyltransferase
VTESPPPRLLRLDGIEPLAWPEGGERALGRDPFAELEPLDPVLERLAFPPPPPRRARREGAGPAGLLERWLGEEVRRRLAAVAELYPAHRPDRFGLSPETVERALPPFLALYRHWFRVRSEGHEHLPREGAAILVANHAGLLPFDGAMATVDVLLHSDPPRLPRAIFDRFVARLGPVQRFFEQVGPVLASSGNLAALLREGHLALVFPEGVSGVVKPVTQRYRLQHFHTGFVRQAMRERAPIVPLAIAGSDDQAPILYDVKPIARRLGIPVAPITPTFPWLGPLGLLPYPVRYRMVYGEPIDLAARYAPEDADDDALVCGLAQRVRRVVQQLLDRSR